MELLKRCRWTTEYLDVNTERDFLLPGSELRRLVRGGVLFAGNVLGLEDPKTSLQLLDLLHVAWARVLLVDLFDDELGVASNDDLGNVHADGSTKPMRADPRTRAYCL